MKKLVLLFLLLLPSFTSHAVLREENLDNTIIVLYSDLQSFKSNMNNYMASYEAQRREYWADLNHTMEDCQESALVLYTQGDYHIFGMSQACQHITDTYAKFNSQEYPFTIWKDGFKSEIERYNRLVSLLSHISDAKLSARGKTARLRCIDISKGIEERLHRYYDSLETDNKKYGDIRAYMDNLEEYNQTRFGLIRDKVFLHGSESYFVTLSHLNVRSREFINDIHHDFFTGQSATSSWMKRRVELILSSLGLLLLSFLLSVAFMKWLCPKSWRTPQVQAKRKYYIATLTTFLFAFLLIFNIVFLLQRYYFITATWVFFEYTLIVGFILLSLTLRLDDKHISQGFKLYLPPMVFSAIVIWYRMALVTNLVVSFTLPALFVIVAAWHLYILVRYSKEATREDNFMAWSTLVVTIALTILCWYGFRFLSLQLIILLIIMFTCVQFIICLRHLLRLNKPLSDKPTLKEIWINPTMDKLVIPLLSIVLLVGSIIWASYIFSMTSWVIELLKTNFIDLPTIARISVAKLLWVAALGFIFNYFIFISKLILHTIFGKRYETSLIPICVTIGTIVTWCIYAIAVTLLLEINNKGIIAAVGGASMGIGLALKDTINNLFCGLSLMAGRVRINDIIECDGFRGKVVNIGIRSTIIETVDGSIIAFLNDQLFTKNFRNLTKNHNYELDSITVEIVHSTDVDKAREVIINSLKNLDFLSPNRKPSIALNEFSWSGVSLEVSFWAPVVIKSSAQSSVREAAYKALSEAGIDISAPQ
jgi:potassium efflux system protein